MHPIIPTDHEIRANIAGFALDNVRKHAEQCKSGGCPSYVHCYLILTLGDSRPFPTCAQRIMQVMEPEPKKSNTCCG
jgi:hypothetical protein